MLIPEVRLWIVVLWLAFTAVWCLAQAVETTEEHAAVDVVVVLDSSGSMRHNDPDMFRVPAAKLLFSLLQIQDRVAVVSFSDQGYPVSYLTALDGARQLKHVFAAVDKVSSKGAFTNLYGGLAAAQKVLRRDPPDDGRKRAIIFMSDGVMDVGDPERDRVLRERLMQRLLPELRASQIEVHSIAFTEQSDVQLLENIARDTDGMYHLARNDADLHRIFADLFERLKGPNRLPMHDDALAVDDRIDTLTLLATKNDPDTKVILAAPDGSEYDAANRADNMQWFESPAFELVTVTKPDPGEWHLLQSDPEASAAYILSDLELETDFDPAYLASGQSSRLGTWMVDGHGRIADPKVLQIFAFSAHIETPDGKQQRVDLSDNGTGADTDAGDGVYSVGFTPYTGGRYRIRLLAKGPGFERERRLAFDVPENTVAAADNPPSLEIQKPEPDVSPAEAEPVSEPVKPIVPEEAPTQKSHWMSYTLIAILVNGLLFFLGWKFLRKAPEENVEL